MSLGVTCATLHTGHTYPHSNSAARSPLDPEGIQSFSYQPPNPKFLSTLESSSVMSLPNSSSCFSGNQSSLGPGSPQFLLGREARVTRNHIHGHGILVMTPQFPCPSPMHPKLNLMQTNSHLIHPTLTPCTQTIIQSPLLIIDPTGYP